MTYKECTKENHMWPESIAIDKNGTIYFTDVWEGSLYRIQRGGDDWLKEELLISGLNAASGLFFHEKSNSLYMGVYRKVSKRKLYEIIKLPLDILDQGKCFPWDYETLKKNAAAMGELFEVFTITRKPNGVIYDEKSNSVYYTWENPGFKNGALYKLQVDQSEDIPLLERYFPNGLSLDRSGSNPVLWVSLTLSNRVEGFSLKNGEVVQSFRIPLGKGGIPIAGHMPDAIKYLDNRGLLVTTFGSGKILYLPKQGDSLGEPKVIAKNLGNPTDVAIGPSSGDKNKKSLFVTTKKGFLIALPGIAKGKVVEIEDFEEKM